MSVAVTQNSS